MNDNRVGQQLGNYRLIGFLGAGGFAEVYLGEHVYLKTQAAVKVLHARLAQDDLEGFLNESRTIAQLVHPQIVRVLDFGLAGTTPFLVMEYAPNGTLRQRHRKGSRLPPAVIAPYLKQVAAALQYAHNSRLVHRDIKPENMLIGSQGQILLSDFGIATIAHSSQSQGTLEVAGTVAYMAPEQVQGRPRPASDQYALGIVAYEWLTGEQPFRGSFTEIATQHVLVPPPSLREKVPDLAPAVEQVVLTALAKDPKDRFATVQAFAAAFEQASAAAPSLYFAPTEPGNAGGSQMHFAPTVASGLLPPTTPTPAQPERLSYPSLGQYGMENAPTNLSPWPAPQPGGPVQPPGPMPQFSANLQPPPNSLPPRSLPPSPRLPSKRATILLSAIIAAIVVLGAIGLGISKFSSPTSTSSGPTATSRAPTATRAVLRAGPGIDAGNKTITLGILTALTGPVAGPIGLPLTRGMEVFFKLVNDTGGINGYKVQLKEKDSRYDPTTQVEQYNTIHNDIAMIAESLGTPPTFAIKDLATADHLLVVASSFSSALARAQYLILPGTPYRLEVENAFDYVVHKLGVQNPKTGIIYQNDDYGQDGLTGYHEAISAYKLNDVGQASYALTDTDFTAQVSQMKSAGAQYVFLTATPSFTAKVIATAAALGYSPQWILQSPAYLPLLLGVPALVPLLTNGHAWVMGQDALWGDTSLPGMQEMLHDVQKYAADQKPDPYFELGYIQAKIVAAILKQAFANNDVSRDGLLKAFESLKNVDLGGLYPGISYGPSPNERVPTRDSRVLAIDPTAPATLKDLSGDFIGTAAQASQF